MKQYIYSIIAALVAFSGLNAQPLNPPSPSAEILPVTLINFSAANENGFALLAWNTAQETNTLAFEIEHSANGQPFMQVGTVKAAGSSLVLTRYSFFHTKPAAGKNLYRLRMVDMDGTWEYSPTVTYNADVVAGMKVYASPNAGFVTVETKNLRTHVRYSIVNIEGKELNRGNITQAKQRVEVSGLAKGTYFIVTEQYGALKFVK